MPKAGSLVILRVAARIGALIGAVGSIVFLLRAPQHPPLLLLMLLGLWGLSPFIGVALADMASMRWTVPAHRLTRATLYSAMLAISLGYLVMYGDDDLRPAGKPAGFVFVVVPLVSWSLLLVVVPIAALLSRRLSRRHSLRPPA